MSVYVSQILNVHICILCYLLFVKC